VAALSEGERARAGLCADCRWARRVTSARGSVFLLCRRAESDPAYPRYPQLPRLACPGYEPEPSAARGPAPVEGGPGAEAS
jgi:hypothetical protein